MPRCPPKDFANRCEAIKLWEKGLRPGQIAQALKRPPHWVSRTLKRYDPQMGLESLRDKSSRPRHSPNQTPAEVEKVICQMKQEYPHWGRRQIAKQLRWQWRDKPEVRDWVSESRVRCVLARHPELKPPPPQKPSSPPRQIDYLQCNLLWAADVQQTSLPDGQIMETIRWLDLHSRFELGCFSAPRLTMKQAVSSFLAVAQQYGLPLLVKTDRDKIFYDATSGLPSFFSQVLRTLAVEHIPIPPQQPWWNGVVERRIGTARQEIQPDPPSSPEQLEAALEEENLFYNHQRCHSRCHDAPPATIYQPSERKVSEDFSLGKVPPTCEPVVVRRKVQTSGRVSLAGRSYYFARRYAGQEITITVEEWQAQARAADGWQRTWDLHPQAHQEHVPEPAREPTPLTRRVSRRGCISIDKRLYYIGVAWQGCRVTLRREGEYWITDLPDGSTKTLPDKSLLPPPERQSRQAKPRPKAPDSLSPKGILHPRRVTKTGQIAFHNRLYYVGVAHARETVYVTPSQQGLVVYNAEQAWLTTCPWRQSKNRNMIEPPSPI